MINWVVIQITQNLYTNIHYGVITNCTKNETGSHQKYAGVNSGHWEPEAIPSSQNYINGTYNEQGQKNCAR